MQLDIFLSDRIKIDPREIRHFKDFLQKMANRLCVGQCQYGPPRKDKLFFSRLKKESTAYGKKGNMEQLLNIAVYAYLESFAPQNPKFHFDNTVDSVTRKEF
jgi:hypothetical protein